jgi:hypothetical protein
MNFSVKIPKILKDIIGDTGMASHSITIIDKYHNFTFIKWSAYYPNKKDKPKNSITPSKVKGG